MPISIYFYLRYFYLHVLRAYLYLRRKSYLFLTLGDISWTSFFSSDIFRVFLVSFPFLRVSPHPGVSSAYAESWQTNRRPAEDLLLSVWPRVGDVLIHMLGGPIQEYRRGSIGKQLPHLMQRWLLFTTLLLLQLQCYSKRIVIGLDMPYRPTLCPTSCP